MRAEFRCRSGSAREAGVATTSGPDRPAPDDSELELDVCARAATLRLSGSLGPRSAATLRILLDALDGMPGPVQVDATEVRVAGEHVVYVLDEAARRRRALGLPEVRTDARSARALRFAELSVPY